MFLATNELVKEKARFLLIMFVIVLIGYLTFFLTGLAYGLATSYTQGIDKWKASGIILQNDANDNIARSLLLKSDYESVLDENSALLGVGSATIEQEDADDVSLFGIDMNSFVAPNITEGQAVSGSDEVVVADELQSAGIALGQTIQFKGVGSELKVVGFTDEATFQTAPIVYMQLDTWRVVASEVAGMTAMRDDTTVSAVVTKNPYSPSYDSGRMSWQTIRDYSFQLPGYSAQVLTFGLMIGFLTVIAAFVLAIFMYVLTLQKRAIFGILKAEGIPSGYIARSVMYQTLIITVIGLGIGLAITLISGLLLGSKVPFLVSPIFFSVIILLYLLFAAIGGLASVRAVTKIDPVEAIG